MELPTIIEKCKEGNPLAWEELVRRSQTRVYGIAYHSTRNAEDAREIVQDVFVKVYQSLQTCPDPELFHPWIVRITRNACIDYQRRIQARPPAHDIPVEQAARQIAREDNPELQFLASSRRRTLYRALDQLTHLNRQLIWLKEIKGLSLAQISTLLNIPIGTVKSRSNRARIELAQRLVESGS